MTVRQSRINCRGREADVRRLAKPAPFAAEPN